MSAILGERLTFGQRSGPDVQLVVRGDEFYARHETDSGYTAVYDEARGLFCYAVVVGGAFVSSGMPVSAGPPPGVPRHLHEAPGVRLRKRAMRRNAVRPRTTARALSGVSFTFGPSGGLLEGRRLTIGSVRGLTILVNFRDVVSTVTQADVTGLLNDPNYTRNGNFSSAREYFRLVSAGKLDYTNDVVGPLRLSHDRDYYVTHLLVEEALDLALAAGVDLGRYDSRNEGVLDALNIMYAGQTQYLGDLWPHNAEITLQRGSVRTNLYLLTSMGRNAGELSIGTFCHENGHLLCRFPDMYDYGERDGDTTESAGIGGYCLMGSGNHLNFGRTPSPVCGYLRELAGWCDTVITLSEPGDYTAKHADYATLLKMPTTDRPNEYFIVENRSKLGLDQSLPSSGLAVYHCDTLGSNELQEGSAARHYQCALLQADGHLDLEHNVNAGDGSDLFGAVAGVALSAETQPASRRWDGADSALVISAISAPGATITFTVGAPPPAAATVVRGEATPALAILDNVAAGVRSTIAIAQAGNVRRVKVGVDIAHTYIGDLVVELTNPAGQTATLHNRAGGSTHNLTATFDSGATAALGALVSQPAAGTWTLAVRDVEAQDSGVLNRWTLEIELDAQPQSVKGEAKPMLKIPDNNPAGITSVVGLVGTGTVRQLKVSVDISHTYIGDLRVELLSPTGRRAILHAQLGGSRDNLVTTYDSTAPSSVLAAFIGQPVEGNWMLRVVDLVGQDTGGLNKWSVEALVS
jgi:M6 family metalloprotease-like protein